jgi:hypothetical protein
MYGQSVVYTGQSVVYTGQSVVYTGQSVVYTGQSVVYTGQSVVYTGESVVYTGSLLCTLVVCCVHWSVCCVHWSRKVRLSSSAPQPSTKVLCHVELIFHVIMSRLKPISLSNFVSPPVDNPANANATPAPACPPVTGWRGNYGPLGITSTIPGFSEVEPTPLVSAAARKPRLRSTPRTISAGTF